MLLKNNNNNNNNENCTLVIITVSALNKKSARWFNISWFVFFSLMWIGSYSAYSLKIDFFFSSFNDYNFSLAILRIRFYSFSVPMNEFLITFFWEKCVLFSRILKVLKQTLSDQKSAPDSWIKFVGTTSVRTQESWLLPLHTPFVGRVLFLFFLVFLSISIRNSAKRRERERERQWRCL